MSHTEPIAPLLQANAELEGRLTKLQQRRDDLWSMYEHVRQRNADLDWHLTKDKQSLEEDGWPDKNAFKVSLLTMQHSGDTTGLH